MRISELSRRTGVPVASIKYYVREGLLPAGQLTSPNQASYDETHEHRLRLIRALLDVGDLSVSAAADVLKAVDDPERPVHKVLGEATARITARAGDQEDAAAESARDKVTALIQRQGWKAPETCASAEALAEALAAMERLGHRSFADELLDLYAEAAQHVARADLAYVARNTQIPDLVEAVVVHTVLGEAALTALRRLAHVDASARQYGDG